MFSSEDRGMGFDPGSSFGQYRIVRCLGRGGMGEVYEAEHRVLGRHYALKLMPATLSSQSGSLQRFEREARVMANLQHPGIMLVDEFGETDGRYWLRMELAAGLGGDGSARSLSDLVGRRGGKLSEDEFLPILEQILKGMAYAHAHGVVHRDLKPSNILFVGDRAKVADFGLVRLVGEEWLRSRVEVSVSRSLSLGGMATMNDASSAGTSTRSLLGTYDYMSPEQKRGEDATAASDVYSLGLMIFRLLTGEHEIGFMLPSQLDGALSAEWDELVRPCLAPNPAQRPADCGALLDLASGLFSGDEPAPPDLRSSAPVAAEPRAASGPNAAPQVDGLPEAHDAQPVAAVSSGSASPPPPPPPPVLNKRGSSARLWPAALLLVILVAVGAASYRSYTAYQSRRAKTAAAEQAWTVPDLGMELVFVKEGSFQMGSNDGGSDEKPVHDVRITRPFWIGKYEVTQGEYESLMGTNPSYFKGARNPVEMVSWNDAVAFCLKLTERERAAGRLPAGYEYRLPTEAEWEYAARGGSQSRGYTYSGSDRLGACRTCRCGGPVRGAVTWRVQRRPALHWAFGNRL